MLQAHLDGLQDGVGDSVVAAQCQGNAPVLNQLGVPLPNVLTRLRKTGGRGRKKYPDSRRDCCSLLCGHVFTAAVF